MNITVDKDFIKRLIWAYDKLGIIFDDYESEDFEVDYDIIRVSFIKENGRCSNKYVKNLDILDLNSAYLYVEKDASKEEKKDLKEALQMAIIANSDEDVKKKANVGAMKKILRDRIEVIEIQQDAENNRIKDVNNITAEDNNNTDGADKVVNTENAPEVANKGRNKASKGSIYFLAGCIILATSLFNYSCNDKNNKEVASNVAIEDLTDIKNDVDINKVTNDTVTIEDNTNNNTENESTQTDNVKEETPVEETKTEEVKTETVEETKVDVHSEEFISNVTDKALSSIQLVNDKYIPVKFDRETIENLVRYAHHDYDEYTGPNTFTNANAYDLLSELVRHGYDISLFYEGLNNYENIKAINAAATSIVQEKGQYEDEFKVYAYMDKAMDEMNKNNFPEAIAVRAYVDNYSMIPSMQMARQEAGVLEMKDTPEFWLDVNKDGQVTYEENAEGRGYEEEKARAMAAKYGEMDSARCAQIYSRISSDDVNSELAQLCINAINEDTSRVRIRK